MTTAVSVYARQTYNTSQPVTSISNVNFSKLHVKLSAFANVRFVKDHNIAG